MWLMPPKPPEEENEDEAQQRDTSYRGRAVCRRSEDHSPIPPKESPNPRFICMSLWPKSRSIPPIPARLTSWPHGAHASSSSSSSSSHSSSHCSSCSSCSSSQAVGVDWLSSWSQSHADPTESPYTYERCLN
ncbi:hypothetical protein EYF80_046677 [Liparis tanakae]|uniref:Uncharacterized protein n=1 Tax=Liparis tanakae TaxID=230148 RepID=A0A4Z2FQE3_9TELE|nr:hypothetical protein EYF80_046677 [Liparis tanakae]